jgi:hypothetical protein
MKNAVVWGLAPCGFIKNRRFGGTCRLHLQGRRNVLKMEAKRNGLQRNAQQELHEQLGSLTTATACTVTSSDREETRQSAHS